MTGGGRCGLSAPLQIERHTGLCDPVAQLLQEQEYFAALTADTARLCVWQPRHALIATEAESRLHTFGAARARARNRGLPVHVRRSGGGAVCLGPGALVVSHLYLETGNDLDASYRDFARRIVTAAADLGISLDAAEVGAAYCNGRFDLAWRGLKVGGIAQRRRLLQGNTRVWIHAVLSVGSESLCYPQAVTEFYADLESSRLADPSRTTTLSHCLGVRAETHDLLQRVGDALIKAFRSASQRSPGRNSLAKP